MPNVHLLGRVLKLLAELLSASDEIASPASTLIYS